jgi:flagellar P-ring protein precursor FlgI
MTFRKENIMKKSLIIILIAFSLSNLAPGQVRLKDIADVEGCASVQVVGYGLVVGLDRTGDGTKSQFTIQSIVNMLGRFGLNIDPKQIKPKNTAAVMVTADLSPYAKPGSRIDVTVSSISDASSLQGGVLLMTPLLGLDGEVYIQAQGPVSIGGLSAGGEGAGVTVNHPLVGRIPGGGVAFKASPFHYVDSDSVTFLLRNPDFTTASRIAQSLNDKFGSPIAVVLDAGSVGVKAVTDSLCPTYYDFLASAENVPIEPDVPARVVINERTGTVVVGSNVRLTSVAITHGSLAITITPATTVSQPPPLSPGQTVTTTVPVVEVEEEKQSMMVVEKTPDVGAIAKALNDLGVKPRDVVAIFQALKEAGALQAELIII